MTRIASIHNDELVCIHHTTLILASVAYCSGTHHTHSLKSLLTASLGRSQSSKIGTPSLAKQALHLGSFPTQTKLPSVVKWSTRYIDTVRTLVDRCIGVDGARKEFAARLVGQIGSKDVSGGLFESRLRYRPVQSRTPGHDPLSTCLTSIFAPRRFAILPRHP